MWYWNKLTGDSSEKVEREIEKEKKNVGILNIVYCSNHFEVLKNNFYFIETIFL
jgi:hypothetical protein